MADPEDRRLPSARPGVAIAEQGVVFLEGPHGVAATLTPEAAAATGENLCRAAARAAQQRTEAPDEPVPLHPQRGKGSR